MLHSLPRLPPSPIFLPIDAVAMGVMWDFIVSMISESFPPKPTWTAAEIPDLSGKVVIMTGMKPSIMFLSPSDTKFVLL